MSEQGRARRKALWFVLGTLGLLVLAVVGVFLDAWFGASKVLEHERRRVKEGTEKLRSERILRPLFFGPEEEGNSWEPLVRALEFMQTLPSSDFDAFPSFSTDANPRIDPPKAERILAAAAPAIEDLKRALRRRWTDPEYAFEQGFNLKLPYLSTALQAHRMLGDAALYRHDSGRNDEAVDFLILVLGIADRIAVKGPIVTQLVRMSATEQALVGLQTMIADHGFSSSQLDRLQTTVDAAAEAQHADGLSAYRVEDLLVRATVIHWTEKERYPEKELGPSWRDAFSNRLLAGRFFRERDRIHGIVERHEKSTHPTRRAALQELEADLKTSNLLLVRYLQPNLASCSLSRDVQSLKLTIARISLAVARYREARGGLPGSLGDLVPGFLQALPIDEANRVPFGYFVKDNVAHVYSWGGDGDDDGGKPVVPTGLSGWEYDGDVVWTVKRRGAGVK